MVPASSEGSRPNWAFGNPPRLVPGQGPEQRGEAFAFERAAEDVGVAWASHVVGNDSGKLDAHPGSVKPEPRNECGGGARHAPGVEHEHDGDAEGAGAVGGASRRIAGIAAVEQPMTPSQTHASASWARLSHSARTPSRPIIHVSRLQAGRPVA